MNNVVIGNIERFSGFADEYDRYRPEMPREAIDIITMYLGRDAGCVVDFGSGTGLSTIPWHSAASKIIGIEPNSDMLSVAREKAEAYTNITYIEGVSSQTGLENSIADVVTCSQSFHWMEPESTLSEAARILKKGGVFAAIDCDWPVEAGVDVEMAYNDLFQAVNAIEKNSPDLKDATRKWDKSNHLANIQKSGLFSFSREVVFDHAEECDLERFIGLALSQGGLQSLLKMGVADILPYIIKLETEANNFFRGEQRKIRFGYRMRLAVK